MIDIKQCNKCDQVKDLHEFYSTKKKSKSRGEYTYHFPYCKECTSKKAMGWQKENKEKYEEICKRRDSVEYYSEERRQVLLKHGKEQRESGYYREWQNKNKDKIRQYQLKRKLKMHEITNDEWETCLIYFYRACAYCGLTEQESIARDNQVLHKEHVDPEGSNTIENNVPACRKCNSSKGNKKIEVWYTPVNENYRVERNQKIMEWISN